MRDSTNLARYALLRQVQTGYFNADRRRLHGVFATAIGHRITTKPVQADEGLCLRLFVNQKLQFDTQQAVVPFDGRIHCFRWEDPRGTVHAVEVPVDVCAADPPGRWRIDQAQMAEAVTRAGVERAPGTVGGWAWDCDDQSLVILSNQHIFGSTPKNVIHLGDREIARTKRGTKVPEMDAAKADPIPDVVAFNPRIFDVGMAIFDTADAEVGIPVGKCGQSSKRTTGVVKHENYTFYDGDNGADIAVYNGFAVATDTEDTPVSVDGDSGSLFYVEEPHNESAALKVVGLLVGSHSLRNQPVPLAVAYHIRDVFDALHVESLSYFPFAAFLDSCFAEPYYDFQFYALRRPDTPDHPAEPGCARGEAFLTELGRRAQEAGTARDSMLTAVARRLRNRRAALLETLVRNDSVRMNLGYALWEILHGSTATEVWNRQLSPAQLYSLAAALDDLGAACDLKMALNPVSEALRASDWHTLDAMLAHIGRTDTPWPDDPLPDAKAR